MYTLKQSQESFTPVEGPMAGRTFAHGQAYAEIPPGAENKFVLIPEGPSSAPETKARPARTGKNGADAPEGEVK